jgi:hypothetical protein
MQRMKEQEYECERCNKRFAHRSGLSRHMKRHEERDRDEQAKTKVSELAIIQEILLTNATLQKSNDQLKTDKQHIQAELEAVRHTLVLQQQQSGNVYINSNNRQYTTFNIQLFLDEKCKNAMNLGEFMQTIQIPENNIVSSQTQGVIRTISDALITALNQLSLYERPIHCSDKKRSTLYIKDNDRWDKDSEHDRMKNVIEEVNYKQFLALKQWMEDHPNFNEDEALLTEYIQMSTTLSTDLAKGKTYKRIIHNVSQEVHVDKLKE